MSRKIVAIGGGENGRTRRDGVVVPYETDKIDQEIVKLTGKGHPHFLFLGHSQQTEALEESYFHVMEKIYGSMYGCECKTITKKDLRENFETVGPLLDWADIIYEGGGDTVGMLQLWRETGFDLLLKRAWEAGKVMCGVSAGAICWFAMGNTAHPNYKDLEVNRLDALGFLPAYFSPHSQESWKYESVKRSLRTIDMVGISLSNCCALEVIDDTYRVIKTDASNYGIEAFCLKTYWENGVYIEENIEESADFKPLDQLLSKSHQV